jgi:hypothetical protein
MVRFSVVLALLAVLASAAQAQVDVRTQGGRVELRVVAAPIQDILDRLSRQTGMKVVYEGVPPRQVVTATLQDRTPAEAVLGVLEGLNLNYALILDASGTRVVTLLVTGAAGSVAAPPPTAGPVLSQAPPAAPPVPRFQPPPQETQLEMEAEPAEGEEAPPVEGQEPQEGAGDEKPGAPGAPAPGVLPPPANYPSSPFAPQPMFPGAPVPGQPPQTVPPKPENE